MCILLRVSSLSYFLLHHMTTVRRVRRKLDRRVDVLPTEMWREILQYLVLNERRRVSCVCRTLRDFVYAEADVWQTVVLDDRAACAVWNLRTRQNHTPGCYDVRHVLHMHGHFIRTLRIGNCTARPSTVLTDHHMKIIGACVPNLTSFSIKDEWTNITVTGFRDLGNHCKGLTQLTLPWQNGKRSTPEFVVSSDILPAVQYVKLRGGVQRMLVPIAGAIPQSVPLTRLTSLTLNNLKGVSGFTFLSVCVSMISLRIIRCTGTISHGCHMSETPPASRMLKRLRHFEFRQSSTLICEHDMALSLLSMATCWSNIELLTVDGHVADTMMDSVCQTKCQVSEPTAGRLRVVRCAECKTKRYPEMSTVNCIGWGIEAPHGAH
jgi:hypothetical protein